jgi:predicted phosphodiesterase
MKIAIASDLHLEFDRVKKTYFNSCDILDEQFVLDANPLPLNNTEGAEVLILAGDIMTSCIRDRHSVQDFFAHVSKEFPNVIYIMGNHEHYHGNFANTRKEIQEAIAKFENVTFLEKEYIILGDTAFFGGTFWTDLKDGDPFVILNVKQAMNDFHVIRDGMGKFDPITTVLENEKTVSELKNCLALAMVPKIVVISHHAPSSLSSHPRFNGEICNYAYHSTKLEDLILDNPIIKLWVHGHTHDSHDYVLGETRIVCNPRGYIGYEESAANWQLKFVEV